VKYSVLPIVKATKFTAHAQYIKASSYWSIPILKRFSAAKNASSQNWLQKWQSFFRKYKGLYKIQSTRPPKRHVLTRDDVT